MKRIILLLLFVFMSVISCDRHENKQSIDLDSVEHVFITADSLNLSNVLLAPRKVFCMSDCIAVFEPDDKEGFLHFYNKNAKLLGKYGIVGNAHNEFISPNVFSNGHSLIVLSMNGKYCEIKGFNEGVSVGEIQKIENKFYANGCNFLAFNRDGSVILDSASSDDMLLFIGQDGKESGYNDYPLKIEGKMHPFMKKNVISSCSYTISNSLDTLFLAFVYYPTASVVSLADKHSSHINLSVGRRNEYKFKGGAPYYNNPVLFYTYAVSSDKYFYALFQNDTKALIHQGGQSEIHVFSRNGNMKRRYVLDRRIYHFSVAPDDSMIYALGKNKELLSEIYTYPI